MTSVTGQTEIYGVRGSDPIYTCGSCGYCGDIDFMRGECPCCGLGTLVERDSGGSDD